MTEIQETSWWQRWRTLRRDTREWVHQQWHGGVWMLVPILGSLLVTGLVALMPGSFTGMEPLDVSTLPPGVVYPWRDPALATYDVRRQHSIHAAADRVIFSARIAEQRMARVHEILSAPIARREVVEPDGDDALGDRTVVMHLDAELHAGTLMDMDAAMDGPAPEGDGTLRSTASNLNPTGRRAAAVLDFGTETIAASQVAAPLDEPDAHPPTPPLAAAPQVAVNSATSSQLQRLPRIGPALAERIIAGRPYRGARDLLAVPGIGRATLAQLEPLISFD